MNPKVWPVATLSALLLFAPLGCESTPPSERSETTEKIELEKAEYPITIGEGYDPYEVAVFVTKRTDLARKLYQDGNLDECIAVLQGLVRYVPDSIRNRYDLGIMLFQRASPHIVAYRNKTNELTNLKNTPGKEAEADRKAPELDALYARLKPDTEEALQQFTIYASAVPSDARPYDMMWRCQLALEDIVGARNNIERMINWPTALDNETREEYTRLRDLLDDILQSAPTERALRSPLPTGTGIAPTGLGGR